LTWRSPQGHEYNHEEAYDLDNQKWSDSVIENNSVTTRTLELPTTTGKSYIYDPLKKSCIETDIKGVVISGAIRMFPDMKNETTEVVEGVLCDKWTKDLGNYNVAVWFTHNGLVPVQMYNSDDEAKVEQLLSFLL
jgi:hypothetical protein